MPDAACWNVGLPVSHMGPAAVADADASVDQVLPGLGAVRVFWSYFSCSVFGIYFGLLCLWSSFIATGHTI